MELASQSIYRFFINVLRAGITIHESACGENSGSRESFDTLEKFSKVLAIVLLGFALAACAHTPRYVGKSMPDAARSGCKWLTESRCEFTLSGGYFRELTGYYSIAKVENEQYEIKGESKVTLQGVAAGRIDQLEMIIVFFNGDIAVHEEVVPIGKTQKMRSFSKKFATDTIFDSTGIGVHRLRGRQG